MSRGLLVIVSGPSGTGKGTVCKRLEAEDDIFLSVSMTSRPRLADEQEGINYYYVDKESFETAISDGKMLEWAIYNGNYYGTPKDKVESRLNNGENVILEIEVQGAFKVREKFPEAVLVFVAPPSVAVLRERLETRGREDIEVINKRIGEAIRELGVANEYDHIIINDDLDACVDEVLAVIRNTAEKRNHISSLLSELEN